MKSANKYIVNILATGFVTLAILSVLFFWGREVCETFLYAEILKEPIGRVKITPSYLVPELDSEPNVVRQSCVSASISEAAAVSSLGVWQNVWALENGQLGRFCIYRSGKKGKVDTLVLFDKDLGLFISYKVIKKKRGWGKKAELYAGPNGIAKTPGKNLGRFTQPRLGQWKGDGFSFIFFDNSLSSFFRIEFEQEKVTKGPKVPRNYRVVQINRNVGLEKGQRETTIQDFIWDPPLRRATAQDKGRKRRRKAPIRDKDGQKTYLVSAGEKHVGTYSKEYGLILDKSGEIRRLDNQTLELSGIAGFLPAAHRDSAAKPRELLSYKVLPFTIEDKYAGTIVGSLSREATKLQIAVFNGEGRLLEKKGAGIDPFDRPWGPTLTIINYVLENLQPAFLGLASYFTAWSFEAAAGHRALFILPNMTALVFNENQLNGINNTVW